MKAWLAELSKTYDVREIFVFADFSNQSIRAEIPKIREVTNYIIETQNASAYVTKDFTDFIMLDHIYQKAMSGSDLSAFIIFSGDGHFSSVASFLRNQCKKTMVVYGVRRAMSSQLRNTASICVEIPNDDKAEDPRQPYFDMIFGNLRFLEDNNRGTQKLYPTFWGTVDAVAAYYNSNRDDVTDAMRYLLERDYIYQTDETVEPRKTIKVIRVNWELAEREGVYRKSAVQKNPTRENSTERPTAAQSYGSSQKRDNRSESVHKDDASRDNGRNDNRPARQTQRFGDMTDKPITAIPERIKANPAQNAANASSDTDDTDTERNAQRVNEQTGRESSQNRNSEQTKKPNSTPRRPKPQNQSQNGQNNDKKPQNKPITAQEPSQAAVTEAVAAEGTAEPVKREQKRNPPRPKKQYKPKTDTADTSPLGNMDAAVKENETDKSVPKASTAPDEKKAPQRLSAEEVLTRAIEEESKAESSLDISNESTDDDKYAAIAQAAGIESEASPSKPKRRRRGRRGPKKPTDSSTFAPEAPD